MKHIYYFGASDCVQCRAAKPKFETEISRLNIADKVTFIDAAEDAEMTAKFGIRGIPHIVITDGDEVVARGHALEVIPKLEGLI